MHKLLERAKRALESSGYSASELPDGRLGIEAARSTGKVVRLGTLRIEGQYVGGQLKSQKAKVAEVLGDAGIPLSGHLAELYGRRQLPTIGFVRPEGERWWAASGMGDRTMERGTHDTYGEACQALEDAQAVAIVTLSEGETGWDGYERLVEWLRTIERHR